MSKRDYQSLRNVILELLGQLGSSREARDYIRRFQKVESHQFAIIKVGGGVLRDDMEHLVSALAFLRQVGLLPIIVHGAGPQITAALAKAGIEDRKIDGLRVSTPEAMGVIRKAVDDQSRCLLMALEAADIHARIMPPSLFDCTPVDAEKLGLVGAINGVDLAPVKAAVEIGSLPIVPCLGEGPAARIMNINSDSITRALANAIRPYKIIFLTPTGGLLDQQGQIISTISLINDFEVLQSADWVHSGMRLKLQEIAALLAPLPASTSVSITSADKLARELFTHNGAGTLIRQGEIIDVTGQPGPAECEEIASLLESCFGRGPKSDYFESLDKCRIVWPQSRTAAAILVRGHQGMTYLDKFAVHPESRGQGLAATLWNRLDHLAPALYWRSRTDNPLNTWYFSRADFSLRRDGWIVFGRGIGDMHMQACAADALARPISWEDNTDV